MLRRPSHRRGRRNAVKDEQECRHAAWLMRWIDLPIREMRPQIVGSGDSTSVECPSNGQPIASDIDKNQDDAVYTVFHCTNSKC